MGAEDVRFGSKADMCTAPAHVRFTPNSDIDCVFRHDRFGPIADIRRFTRSDHRRAAGGEKECRVRATWRPSEIWWQLNGKISRVLTFEYAGDIDGGTAISIGVAGTIAHQPTSLRMLARDVDRG